MSNETVSYFALIQQNDNGKYGGMFPDLDGWCAFVGDTLEAVKDSGSRALTAYLKAEKSSGQPFPEAKFDPEQDDSGLIVEKITINLNDLV